MRRNSATRRNFRNAPNFPGLRKMLRYQKNSPDSVESAEFCKVTPIPPDSSEFCRIQRITPNPPNSSGFCRMADFSRIHPARRSGDSEIIESCGGVEFHQNGKMEGDGNVCPVCGCLRRRSGEVSDDTEDVLGCPNSRPANYPREGSPLV